MSTFKIRLFNVWLGLSKICSNSLSHVCILLTWSGSKPLSTNESWYQALDIPKEIGNPVKGANRDTEKSEF